MRPKPKRVFLPTIASGAFVAFGLIIGFGGMSALSSAQSADKPSAGIVAVPPQGASLAQPTQLANTVGGYGISGTVVSKTDGHPLVRARITIADEKTRDKPQSVITSDDGKFEFTGLPAGKYSISGSKRGFISAGYDQHDQYSTAIVIGAGLDTENLVLKLAPSAVLTGKVLDESGDPVRRATVTLYQVDHGEGFDQIRQNHSAQTDDLGVYEITPVRPGTYYVSANAKPWYATHPPTDPANSGSKGDAAEQTVDRSLDVAYPLTYYPDVTDPDSAMPVPVQGGDRVQVDIHLSPVPALHVLFHVADDGRHGIAWPTFQQRAFDGSADGSTAIQPDGMHMIKPGIVEVTGIPAGRYALELHEGENATHIDQVDLTRNGEEIDSSIASAAGNVKVSVQVQGEATVPQQLSVALRSGGRRPVGWHPVDSKGEANLENIPAGSYEFVVFGGSRRYSIFRISAEGAEVSGHTLTLAAGASPSVSLTLVAGKTEIRGIASKAGKAAAGAMVVLVPKNPGGNRDLFRRDQSDLDGTFTLYGVVPGSYTVLAIENGWDLDWSEPDIIAAYLKHGRKIEVGSQLTQKLEDSVEVQSK